MKPLTQLAHEALAKVLEPGDIAIDLTAGNGWDTLFLTRCVGSTGHVYAFDIQTAAIQATQRLLEQRAAHSAVTLALASHATGMDTIPVEQRRQLKAAMMNLGYLPGGDKSIVTQVASTLAAIQAVLDWLQPRGALSILAYTGHPGGKMEADAVHAMLRTLDWKTFEVIHHPAKPVDDVPILYLVYKKSASP